MVRSNCQSHWNAHSFEHHSVVIDADAFYASVEELDNPSLIGKAFGVGSGVLTTASYEARKYGCRSAMAGFVAKVCLARGRV